MSTERIALSKLIEEARLEGYDVVADGNGGHAKPEPTATNLESLDWQTLTENGIPEIDYLDAPYFPRLARIWIWGATGTAKSIYGMWKAAAFSRRGLRVSYFSEENPLAEELRRLALLTPEPEFFRIFYRTGADLQSPEWVRAMLETTQGDAAVFFDSWTDLWSGDEGDNRAVQQFDATVLKPLQAQNVTPIVIHHTGHPTMFSNRGGATAGRGASSLGQKADVTLEFKAEADGAFTIVYGKPRIGGDRQPDRTFQVTDLDDGGIDIVEVASARARAVAELVEKMVQAVLTSPRGYLTSTEVRVAAGGGRALQAEAMPIAAEDARVHVGTEKVETRDGRQRDAQVWRPVRGGLF